MSSYSKILQLDTAGSFDFYTTVVSLDAVDPRSFKRLRSHNFTAAPTMDDFVIHDPIKPLIAHEYTHFVDATSTCWGLYHLSLLDNAYRAAGEMKEYNFHHLKTLHDHLRGLRIPLYYRTVETKAHPTLEWRYQVTIGRRFMSNGSLENAPPILFCSFYNPEGQRLARAPISTLSLLETSAMAQELQSRYSVLSLLSGPEALVEKRRQSDNALRHLYDHTITEYSVCAHLVANYQQCTDIIAAYILAGMLSRFVLDFPWEGYQFLAKSPIVGALFKGPDAKIYETAIRQGLLVGDGGMLYYLLVHTLPQGATDSRVSMVDALETTVRAWGLRMDQLRDSSLAEGQKLATQVLTSPSAALRAIGMAGYKNQNSIGQSDLELDFDALQLPQAMFGDCESYPVFESPGNELGKISTDFFFNDLYPLERRTEDFAEACV